MFIIGYSKVCLHRHFGVRFQKPLLCLKKDTLDPAHRQLISIYWHSVLHSTLMIDEYHFRLIEQKLSNEGLELGHFTVSQKPGYTRAVQKKLTNFFLVILTIF